MQVERTPPEYASWDVTVPTLPARSRLYRLEPYGIGTPWVESLTGYITRLAEAHCVSTGILYAKEIAPVVGKGNIFTFRLTGTAGYPTHAINGLGVTALCPGFVSTNLFTSAPLGDKQQEANVPPKFCQISPERVARAAVRAIRRDRRIVVLEPAARLTCALNRITPWFLDFFFHLGQRKRVARKMAKLEPDQDSRRAA